MQLPEKLVVNKKRKREREEKEKEKKIKKKENPFKCIGNEF